MTSPALLARLEDIIDASGIRTADRGPAPCRGPPPPAARPHLTAGHAAGPGRPPPRPPHRDPRRPDHPARRRPAPARGEQDWKAGPHQLTYRQAERTFGLIADALEKQNPDGTPSAALAAVLDDLLEASIPAEHKDTSSRAGRGLDRRGNLLPPPAPRQQATAPTPKRPGGTATPTCPAPKARCSSATTSPPPP